MTSGWKTVKLGEIADYVREKVKVSQLDESTYVSTENMLPNKGGIVPASTLPTGTLTQAFRRGDVLVSNIRPYFKKIWFTTFEGGCSADVLVFRAKGGIDSSFLRYALSNDSFFAYSMASSKGTKMPRGDKQSIMRYELPLPPLDVQRRIAAVLKPLDDKIELNARINSRLERVAQVLFKRQFVRFEPSGGTMPPSWRVLEFSSFLTPRNEKSNDVTLPLFSVTDTGIYPREEKFNKRLSMTNNKNKVLYSTDLVFGMSREILNWGIMRAPKGGVSSAYNVYAVDKNINSFYLESFMKAHTRYFKDLIRPASREGQGIDKTVLMRKVLPLPPDDVLQEYYRLEKPMRDMIAHNTDESRTLARLRDVLLPRLMSGAVDVGQVLLNTIQEGGAR